MEPDKVDQKYYVSFRAKVILYPVLFVILVGASILHEAADSGSWQWSEVWLNWRPNAPIAIATAVFVLGLVEICIRYRKSWDEAEAEKEARIKLMNLPSKPLTWPWAIATFFYVVFTAIFPIVAVPGYLIMSPVFVSLGMLAIYTEEIQLRGASFYRQLNPFSYWLIVFSLFAFGVISILAGNGVI